MTATRARIRSGRPAETGPRATIAGAIAKAQLGRFGLLVLLALVLVAFGAAKPSEFATWANVRVTLDQQSPVIIGGLAVLLPLLTGEIDLSVGANISLSNILLAALATNNHVPVVLAIIIAVLGSTLVGLINGLIVEKLQVDSFVGTLGMATLLGGVGLAYSHSTDILSVPGVVTSMVRDTPLLVPLSVVYAIVLAAAVGLVLRYLPVGRRIRAVGANPRAAALTGIRPGLYRIVSFTVGGALAGAAGVVLTGQLASASAEGGANSLLLPIFAAVFLGSTVFTPGRPNVLGLWVAALFLAFVSSGLVMLGAPAWESPLINGAALIAAVALSSMGDTAARPQVPRRAAEATRYRGDREHRALVMGQES